MNMIRETVSDSRPLPSNHYRRTSELEIHQAQQIIYTFLLEIVKAWPPEDVLEEFKRLFVEHIDSVSSETIPALHTILFANNEREFRNTLKRCCYILVNNWEVARQYEAIQSLIKLFQDSSIERRTLSPTLRRSREWLINFRESQDFSDLELFAARFLEEKTINRPDSWAARYTSYLLVPQYINVDNPIEQRQAARALSQRLKDKFKFELAMYTAHSQSAFPPKRAAQNPTALGDSALRLVKAIVIKRGKFSYKNLARLFLTQVRSLKYRLFKPSLLKYLLFSVQKTPISEKIYAQLEAKLLPLYPEHDEDPIDRSMILRTCNRVIDYLTTEDKFNPSPLFTLILSQGNSLTLVIILLKVILISRNSLHYLEARIADLIQYYEQFPQNECRWVINFLEVFQVTFAIYTENVEYNLVQIHKNAEPGHYTENDIEAFRIFSQMLYQPEPPLESLESVDGDGLPEFSLGEDAPE